jgi:hypothetical protein
METSNSLPEDKITNKGTVTLTPKLDLTSAPAFRKKSDNENKDTNNMQSNILVSIIEKICISLCFGKWNMK